jgi:hypothetical protein
MREPFELPDDQCERLTRDEMQAMQMLMSSLSNVRYAKEDLQRRLGTFPGGIGRMNMLIGQFESLFRDLCGTVSDKQRKHLRGVCNDMEVRLVPKLTGRRTSLLLTPEEGKELVTFAQAQCVDCLKETEEAKRCKLCQLLTTVVPLNNYDGILCPYSRAEWEE